MPFDVPGILMINAREQRRTFPREERMSRSLSNISISKAELQAEEMLRDMMEKVRTDPEFFAVLSDFHRVYVVMAG